MTETIKVAVLLKHYEGDENWSAHVPAIEDLEQPPYVPLAEGPTPEEAAAAIVPDLMDGIQRFPELTDLLRSAPKLAVTEVDVSILNKT